MQCEQLFDELEILFVHKSSSKISFILFPARQQKLQIKQINNEISDIF